MRARRIILGRCCFFVVVSPCEPSSSLFFLACRVDFFSFVAAHFSRSSLLQWLLAGSGTNKDSLCFGLL